MDLIINLNKKSIDRHHVINWLQTNSKLWEVGSVHHQQRAAQQLCRIHQGSVHRGQEKVCSSKGSWKCDWERTQGRSDRQGESWADRFAHYFLFADEQLDLQWSEKLWSVLASKEPFESGACCWDITQLGLSSSKCTWIWETDHQSGAYLHRKANNCCSSVSWRLAFTNDSTGFIRCSVLS